MRGGCYRYTVRAGPAWSWAAPSHELIGVAVNESESQACLQLHNRVHWQLRELHTSAACIPCRLQDGAYLVPPSHQPSLVLFIVCPGVRSPTRWWWRQRQARQSCELMRFYDYCRNNNLVELICYQLLPLRRQVPNAQLLLSLPAFCAPFDPGARCDKIAMPSGNMP